MAPSRSFSPPLPPNATYNHPKLALNILPSARIFVAGGKLTGAMEVCCTSDKVALGEMGMEFLGIEELRTSEHTAQTTVCGPAHTIFQGPSRPPSNAVKADAPPVGGHYYPALKGRTRFPFAFALPHALPSSLTFGSNARVAYTLRATCQVATISTGERALVTKTIGVKIVERLEDWDDPAKKWEDTVEERGEAKGEHGMVYAEARVRRSLWWPGETSPGQGKVAVEVMIRNTTKRDISGMRLILGRQLAVAPSLSNGRIPSKLVFETMSESTFRGAEYLFPGEGGQKTVIAKCPLDALVPTERNGATGAEDGGKECFSAKATKLFQVECVIRVAIEMGALSPDLVITLPITIAQATSLPPAAHKTFSPPPSIDTSAPSHIDLLPPPPSNLLSLGGSLSGRASPVPGSPLTRPSSPSLSSYAPSAVNGWNAPPSPMASPLPSPRFYPADHVSRGPSPAPSPRVGLVQDQPPFAQYGTPAPMSLGPAGSGQAWSAAQHYGAQYHQQVPMPPQTPALDPRHRSQSMGPMYQRDAYHHQSQQPPPQAWQAPSPHLPYRAPHLTHSQSNPQLYAPASPAPSPMMSPYGGIVESPSIAPSPIPWGYAPSVPPTPAPLHHRPSPAPPPRPPKTPFKQHTTPAPPTQSAPPRQELTIEQRRARHQSMPTPPAPLLSVDSLGVASGQRDWNSMPDRPKSARGDHRAEDEVRVEVPKALPPDRPTSMASSRRMSLPATPKTTAPPPAPSSRYAVSPQHSPRLDRSDDAIRAAFAAAGVASPGTAGLETIGEAGESRAGTIKDVSPKVLAALKQAAAPGESEGRKAPERVKVRSVKGVKPRTSEESVEALENIAALREEQKPADEPVHDKDVAPLSITKAKTAKISGTALEQQAPTPHPASARPSPAGLSTPQSIERAPSRMLRSQSAGLAGLASMLNRSASTVQDLPASQRPTARTSLSTPKSPIMRVGTPSHIGSTGALRAKSTSISLSGALIDATPDPDAKRERAMSAASAQATPKTPSATWVPPASMTRSRTADVLAPPLEKEESKPPRPHIASVAPEALFPVMRSPSVLRATAMSAPTTPVLSGLRTSLAPAAPTIRELQPATKVEVSAPVKVEAEKPKEMERPLWSASSRVADWLMRSDSADAKLARSTTRSLKSPVPERASVPFPSSKDPSPPQSHYTPSVHQQDAALSSPAPATERGTVRAALPTPPPRASLAVKETETARMPDVLSAALTPSKPVRPRSVVENRAPLAIPEAASRKLDPSDKTLTSSPTQLTRRSRIRRQGSSPNLASSDEASSTPTKGVGPGDAGSNSIEDELWRALEETNAAMEKVTSRRLSTPGLMRPDSRTSSPAASPALPPSRPSYSPEISPPGVTMAEAKKGEEEGGKERHSIYKSARGGKGGQVTAVAAQWARRAVSGGSTGAPLSEVPRVLNAAPPAPASRKTSTSVWEISAALGASDSGAHASLGLVKGSPRSVLAGSGGGGGPAAAENDKLLEIGSATGRGGLRDLIRRWDSQRNLAV